MLKRLCAIAFDKRFRNIEYVWSRLERRMPFLQRKNPFYAIDAVVRVNRKFDAAYIDRMIADAVEPCEKGIKVCETKDSGRKVAYLVSSMADASGGHNKLIVNGFRLLAEDYECKLFLTHKSETEEAAPRILKEIRHYSGVDAAYTTSIRDAVRLAQEIVDYNPAMLFVYGNPNDYWAIAVVALLKRVSNVKVMVSQHTTHYPCIGVTFSDITIHAAQSFAYIDYVFRKNRKFLVSKGALVCGRIEWQDEVSPEDKLKQRAELGVPDGFLLTVSSGAGYKFFNADGASDYFKMIKNMLVRNTNVVHVMRVWGRASIREAIREIVSKSGVQDRLLILPPTKEYDTFYGAADLYIDSIPVASALTMVELMRMQIPYVVFRNQQNTLWSFDEYQRDDYPFMYSTAEEMQEGIELLLHDEKLRKSELKNNFEFYMQNFEGSACKTLLRKVVDNVDHLDDLCVQLTDKHYGFSLDADGNPSCEVYGGL